MLARFIAPARKNYMARFLYNLFFLRKKMLVVWYNEKNWRWIKRWMNVRIMHLISCYTAIALYLFLI